MIKRFFSPPRFENEEDNFRAKFINGFAWVVTALLSLAMIPYIVSPGGDMTVVILSGLMVVVLSSLLLLRHGLVRASAWIIVVLGWIGIGFQAYTADGVKDVIIMAFIAVGLLASIVINHRAGSLVILSSIAVIVFLAVRESTGFFHARIQDPIIYGRDLSFIFAAVTILIYFSTTSLRDAIRRASTSESELRGTNKSLQELNQTLEERVASRTSELEQASQRLERRSKQFEAIAQVASATVTQKKFEDLLATLPELISQKFGHYHVGLFLLDEDRAFAVLRSTNSEGGKKMLARNHKLRLGQTGIVGYVAATGTPRIALDVGVDAAFFNNPDLPLTHSEMALPLILEGTTLGVLDIQSTERDAFSRDDVEALSVLAEQVAVALQNSRDFESTQKIIEETQRTAGGFLKESWQSLKSRDRLAGYMASDNTVKPLDSAMDQTILEKLSKSREALVVNGEKPMLTVPIRVAGSVVGALDIQLREDHDWDSDEVDIAKAVADRLSLALEAATLLETTQNRAEIERLTADIAGRIGSSTRFDSILRTAAEELSRVLGGSEVLVQIQSEALEDSAGMAVKDNIG